MNRRDLLSALPAAALAPSALMAGMAETPVARLFKDWKALEDIIGSNQACRGMTEAEVGLLIDRESEIERAMVTEPARTAADMLMKVIATTCYGDFGIGGAPWFDKAAFWQEVMSFVGLAGPRPQDA